MNGVCGCEVTPRTAEVINDLTDFVTTSAQNCGIAFITLGTAKYDKYK
jgi:hypothetical protein